MKSRQGNNKKILLYAGLLIILAAVYTVLVKVIDVQAVGPMGSEVGFATINMAVHGLFGVSMFWYDVTDFLGKVAIATAFPFIIVGLAQLIKRRSLFKVDKTILVLGAFYLVVLAVYFFFEVCVINYRPIMMDGVLEASYPSSHTVLLICFMSAAIIESGVLIKNKFWNSVVQTIAIIMMAVTVIGRLVSGVHWFTDIIGGVLISAALVMAFYGIIRIAAEKDRRDHRPVIEDGAQK